MPFFENKSNVLPLTEFDLWCLVDEYEFEDEVRTIRFKKRIHEWLQGNEAPKSNLDNTDEDIAKPVMHSMQGHVEKSKRLLNARRIGFASSMSRFVKSSISTILFSRKLTDTSFSML